MHPFAPRGKQQYRVPTPPISVEVLENRRLLSGSVLAPLDTTPSPVAALSVNATAGKKFNDVVGTWTIAGGLPTQGSGVIAIAIVNWGDGKTSHAKFVDDGSGVIQIVGSHAWAKPGTFQTVVNVEEFPRKHPHQLTDIGQGDGSAVVAPKPHAVSVKGTLTGTYTTPLGNPDARSYDFTGTGTAGRWARLASADRSLPPDSFDPPRHRRIYADRRERIGDHRRHRPPPDRRKPVAAKDDLRGHRRNRRLRQRRRERTISIALDTTANTSSS